MPMADRSYIDHSQPAAVKDQRWTDEPRPGLQPALTPDVVLLRADAVVVAVEHAFELSAGAIASRDRTRHVSEARDAVYWLLRRHSRMSSVQLGRTIGRRDHASVLAAIRRCEARRERDAWFRETTDRLERELVERAKGAAA